MDDYMSASDGTDCPCFEHKEASDAARAAQGDFKTAIKPRQQATPCGECHLQPGERCDVCGARAAQGDKT
jgi:hypothetical protein